MNPRKKTSAVYRTFARYVTLNILSMAGLSFYIFADTYFISRGVGSAGIAALNLVLPVYSLISGVGLMVGMGASTRFSVFLAENAGGRARACFTHAALLGVLFGAAFTALGMKAPALAGLLGADRETLLYAAPYLQTILSFSCAFIINQILVCFVRNDGRPHLAMTAMLCGSFGNVALDYLFIFPLKMGMFGAALATGLAPVLSMAVLSVHFFQKRRRFRLVRCRLSARMGRNILAVGLPAFITEFSSGVIMLMFNIVILSLSGTIAVAAYGIIANLALVAVSIFTGIAQGIQPIISHNLGLGNRIDIKKSLFCALALALALGALFYLAGSAAAGPLVALFNRERSAQLQTLAQRGAALYFSAFPAMGVNIVAAAFFSSVCLPRPSFIISITRGCAALIPLTVCLSSLLKMDGVWIAIPCTEALTLLLSVVLLARRLKSESHPDRI